MTDGASYEARVTRAVRKYRRDLINRDHDAQKQFALQLREAHETLLRELEAARTAVDAARTRGGNENTFRLQRALDLAKQAEALLGQYAQNGTSYIANQQREVARTAYAAAQEFLDTTSPPPPGLPNASSFMTFPQGALEVITAATRSGPVAELLNRYGADAAKTAGKVLTQAIVLGTNPTVVAKQLSNELAVPLWKGQQIARTEINRAYQESLRETWRQNKEITPKWIWRSGRTTTTCAVCWAMDGTEHDVEEPMGSHPSCRCSMVPAAISWDDLAAQFGIEMPEGDFDPPREMTGPEAFDLLSDDEKRAVLGPGKFRAFNAGEIRLEDLVRERRSDDWGLSRSEGSLQGAKDRAIARSSGGGSGSGEPPAPPAGDEPIPWRPTMEEAEARRWAAQDGGVLADETFYHFGDDLTAEGIRARGLQPTQTSAYGNFIYTTEGDSRGAALSSGAASIRFRHSLVVHARNVLTMESGEDLIRFAREAKSAGFVLPGGGEGVAGYLREHGFDAIRLGDRPRSDRWMLLVETDQVVIIDGNPTGWELPDDWG